MDKISVWVCDIMVYELLQINGPKIDLSPVQENDSGASKLLLIKDSIVVKNRELMIPFEY